MKGHKPSILRFRALMKPVIWGGKRIASFKGIDCDNDHIGESWELSPMPGNESVAETWPYQGETLSEIVASDPEGILGSEVCARTGGKFPLLIKFIDSADDLSIQVHPDDRLAAARHNSLGKTEMWYSIDPAPGAYLYAGFSRVLTPDEYRAAVKENTIVGALRKFDVKRGDTFFLPAGRVHSIGRGNFVLEVQQASDVTYRIYDYDRRDKEGNPRQLHVEESIDALNFGDTEMEVRNFSGDVPGLNTIATSEYFTVSLLKTDGDEELPLKQGESFTIMVCVEGEAVLDAGEGQTYPVRRGETLLVPAWTPSLTFRPMDESTKVVLIQRGESS